MQHLCTALLKFLVNEFQRQPSICGVFCKICCTERMLTNLTLQGPEALEDWSLDLEDRRGQRWLQLGSAACEPCSPAAELCVMWAPCNWGESITRRCLSFLSVKYVAFEKNTFWNFEIENAEKVAIANCKTLASCWISMSYTIWIKTRPLFAWDASRSTGELLLSLLCSKVTSVNTIQMCILRVCLNMVFAAWR